MEKDLKRSVRRHHLDRLKAKRKSYWGFGRAGHRNRTEMDARRKGMVAQYPSVCSCYMCGNPRKWWKEVTLKEKLHKIVANEDVTLN